MITDVAIVVPAHDEEDEITDCLEGLYVSAQHAQLDLQTSVRVRICVVLDDCQDATPMIAQGFAGCETRTVAVRNVGAARAAGVRYLLQNAVRPERIWVANTDADSVVPVDWLAQMVRLANGGADVVLGTVVPAAGLRPDVQAVWRSRHTLRHGHGHVHGANLGIRASTLFAVGGWSPLAIGEDVDLVERIAQAGHLHVERSASIPVRTSSRLRGRTEGGFATFLRDLHAMPVGH